MADRFDVLAEILKRLDNEFPEDQRRVAAEYCIRYLRTRRELYFKKARTVFRAEPRSDGERMRLDPDCDGSAKISMENLGTILNFAHLEGSARADEALLELLDLLGILIERHVRPPFDMGSEMFLDATRAIARSMERLEKKAGGYQLEFENEAQWFTRDDISADRVTTESEGDARRTEAAAMSREMERLRIADTENRNKIAKKVIIEESGNEETGERPRESMPPPSTPFDHRREGRGGGRPEAGRLPFPPVTRQDLCRRSEWRYHETWATSRVTRDGKTSKTVKTDKTSTWTTRVRRTSRMRTSR